MQYRDVCIESFGYTLPTESWDSAEIESQLAPLYQRLKLPAGRLELISGIKQRRFWPIETRVSQLSFNSCQLALEAADISREQIGCLIHGSVCRDFLEPATACVVHHRLGLPSKCLIYDVSNACLGMLNGMIQASNMIQLGQIQAALVVGSENGRQLVENTIKSLNSDRTLTRKSIKSAIASLTIGSASCAVLLVHRNISRTDNRLHAAAVCANTQFHDLCESQHDQAGSNMRPLMQTDSEMMMAEGIKTGMETFEQFLRISQWTVGDIDRTICHQVGATHRKAILESMGIDPGIDFATFPWLGNTGSAAMPVTMAIACQQGFIGPNDRVAMLGIGSGINCLMLGATWQKTHVLSDQWPATRSDRQLNPTPVASIRGQFFQ